MSSKLNKYSTVQCSCNTHGAVSVGGVETDFWFYQLSWRGIFATTNKLKRWCIECKPFIRANWGALESLYCGHKLLSESPQFTTPNTWTGLAPGNVVQEDNTEFTLKLYLYQFDWHPLVVLAASSATRPSGIVESPLVVPVFSWLIPLPLSFLHSLAALFFVLRGL